MNLGPAVGEVLRWPACCSLHGEVEGGREGGRSMTETEIQSGRGEKSGEINAKLRLPFHLGEGLK